MSEALDTARRALAETSGEALVTVTRERSAMLRFARSRPTQATSIDDLTVEIAILRHGHVGRAATNRLHREALGECARAAALAAEAAADSAGEGHYPGFPGAATPRAHDDSTPRPRGSTRGPAQRRCRRPSTRRTTRSSWAASGPRATSRRRSPRRPASS
ncbi:MAG TPA: DNA gyrase modulator [Thermoleophilaceae bacterium]|nr:DNA gyrase modulator [Thermoleophilaceae bacterium]